MKIKIIESNKYKRYNLYFIQFGGIYSLLTFVFLSFAIISSLTEESAMRIWIVIGVVMAFWSLAFLPWILYYGIKMLLMRKNAELYKSYTGIITSIRTSDVFRTDYRMIDIEVVGFKETLSTKVYKGSLYDEVAKNVKVEIAYNEKSDDIIVLRVF